MSRKSRKEKAVEEAPVAPPPEPAPDEIPQVVPGEPPQQPTPEPETAAPAPVEEPATTQPAVVPQSDDELPPPPSDIAEQTKKYPKINTRKPGIGSAMKRAGVIFGKDVSTMAKHGLVGALILLVFLMVIFYISSYAMFMLVTTSMGGDGEGGNGPNLTNDGSLIANAGNDISVTAGTTVTLDSTSTVHSANIMYVEWRIMSETGQLPDDITMYGPVVHYQFSTAGAYNVSLSIVDSDWNYDEDNLSVAVALKSTDNVSPMLSVEANPPDSVPYGSPTIFNATNSTDNVGIVNYTWIFKDVIDSMRYGPVVSYTWKSAGGHQVTIIARDDSGNFARQEHNVQVVPNGPDNQSPNAQMADLPKTLTVGDSVELDASNSNDNQGIVDYTWFVKLNDTLLTLNGQRTSFTPHGFGMYEIVLVVRDQAGNAGTDERQALSLVEGMDMPSMASWTSTPLGQDIPFNVLTFIYGAALLACVIYLGGLFSKGFAYEIQKGTAKTLFFAPVSVTNMVFAKMLYPLAMGPIFIFPLILISTLPLQQPIQGVFMITLVSYLMTSLVLASAAYGSCLIYAATKRMSIKPTALARTFMYLSLIATLAVFVGLAYLMDQWLATNMWTGMYAQVGTNLAMFSPFHQGGILLSNMLVGTTQSLDWIVFVIPAVLIAGGVAASRKLFPDLFSRE